MIKVENTLNKPFISSKLHVLPHPPEEIVEQQTMMCQHSMSVLWHFQSHKVSACHQLQEADFQSNETKLSIVIGSSKQALNTQFWHHSSTCNQPLSLDV